LLPVLPLRNSFPPDITVDPVLTALEDAYLKGFDINIEKAYPNMRKNALEMAEGEDSKNGKGLLVMKSTLENGNFVGDPVETQKKVKTILSTEYNNYDGGIPGNDNAGQTSAWYVFSAMGFYPVSPGSGEYQLSSPIFSEVELNLNPKYYPGEKFKITTDNPANFSTFNTVHLNHKENGFVLRHEDIRLGGQLKFSNSKR